MDGGAEMVAYRLIEAALRSRRLRSAAVASLGAMALAACASVSPPPGYRPATGSTAGLHGTDKPYEVDGRWYYPHSQPGYDEVGQASWYGQPFHNRHTADGEIFDQFSPSAAHRTLPLPCIVEVTNLDNGRRLQLRVNDRGPFVADRILDVSRAAAEQLGFRREGLTRVRVRYVGPAPPLAPVSYAHQDRAPPTAANEDDSAASRPAAIAPPPSPLLAAPLTPPPGGYAVQAGAFASRDNAQRAADQLASAGAPSIQTMTTRRGLTLYRVVLAGYADASAAEGARAQVAAAGFGDARVIAPD